MIRYRDLSMNWRERRKHLSRINIILKTGKIIDGDAIAELEKRIATYCNRKYAIAVNSGTSAVFLALKSLGIKEGDEVIVPCLGVVPIVNPILMLGAKPVFVDVREDYNMNPRLIMDKITENTKAILAVDYTGMTCEFDSLNAIAQVYGLYLIEDASQAFGATHRGKPAGSFGDISVMSMNPMKVLGAIGEAGMILTNNEDLADTIRYMRYNGLIDKSISDYVSLNYRMDTIQASILLSKMDDIDRSLQFRQENANIYTSLLSDVCVTPKENSTDTSSYFTYNIRVKNRDGLYNYLSYSGIETQKRDAVLLPHQLPNRKEYEDLKFLIGDEIAKESISLPMHDKLKYKDILEICETIKRFYGK